MLKVTNPSLLTLSLAFKGSLQPFVATFIDPQKYRLHRVEPIILLDGLLLIT